MCGRRLEVEEKPAVTILADNDYYPTECGDARSYEPSIFVNGHFVLLWPTDGGEIFVISIVGF